ncbi:MAG: dihydroorotase [Treponema sp.]|nr:dihydroorotase [Treponema sp.]
MNNSLVIYNVRLVDEELDCNGAIFAANGKIIRILKGDFSKKEDVLDALKTEALSDITFIDGKKLTLMPTFIDMHVHLRYPGQTQKEELSTGLKAAAAGGVGTLIAMPNTTPVVSSIELAKSIEDEGNALGFSKLFQTVSLTKDFDGKDTSHLDALDRKITPVISEDGKDVLDSAKMLEAMQKAAEKNIIVSCHSEDPSLAALAKPYREKALALMRQYKIPAWGVANENQTSSLTVPPEVNAEIDDYLTQANEILACAEDAATERNLLLAEVAGCHVHIAHVSTKNSLDSVRRAKLRAKENAKMCASNGGGFSVSCEVTPHHIALCGTSAPEIRALVNPPLRSKEDRLAVIQALKDGTADVISTDHAPHTMDDKAHGSPGFSGIETSYAVCNTVLVKENGFSETQLSRLMSANPARLLKLNKGRLLENYDADFVLANPGEKWTIHGKDFFSKGKATPFEGKSFYGKVHATFISGKQIFALKN